MEICPLPRMAFHLPSVLKALLFSSGQPLSIKDIQAVFARYHEQHEPPAESADAPAEAGEGEDKTAEASNGTVPSLVTAAQIREAVEELSHDLEANQDVYLIDEGAKGYRIVTNPTYAPWVRALREEPPPARLSPAALETLAVVAYRQPVTRSEIESIRGVSADAGLNKLLERELIYITGRAELPGRPLQYGSTDKFLEFVGVKSLVELPASDVLSPRQIDEWLHDAMNPTTPGDAEMGLPLEEGEGETPMTDEAHLEIGARHDENEAPATEAAETDSSADASTATEEEPAETLPEETPAPAAPDQNSDDDTKPTSS
jgi:segregation and condensation protein B